MTQLQTVVPELVDAGIRIAGLALLSGLVVAVIAFVYRWYVHDGLPDGIAVLAGLSIVALWLNTESALSEAIVGDAGLLEPETAAFTISAFFVAGVLSDVGRRVGDRSAERTVSGRGVRELGDVSQVVQSIGRAVVVKIPPAEAIDDISGYDPVPAATKAEIADERLVFPRRITVAELRERVVARLREDYGVGHVDLEIEPDGTVTYLAVGSRAAGIGATLPPGTVAVAVRADPAFSASPGDAVQVWRDGAGAERVTTAELRATAGDVVTLAVDQADADDLDQDTRYRLVTLPGDPAVEREFVSLLRTADETMAAVTIEEGSPIVAIPLGALDVTVAAVRTDEGVEAIPKRTRVVEPGDTIFVIASPGALRRFEAAAVASVEPESTGEPATTTGGSD